MLKANGAWLHNAVTGMEPRGSVCCSFLLFSLTLFIQFTEYSV